LTQLPVRFPAYRLAMGITLDPCRALRCGPAGQPAVQRWRRFWIVTGLLLSACGGGGSPTFALTINGDFATSLDTATLAGTVSLPAGSERAGGTLTMPRVTCQLGAHTMTWSNPANGTSGAAFAYWDCDKDVASWFTRPIPLAIGANPVTVAITAGSQTAQAAVTITRSLP
jgi:hypothetical protein